MESSVESRKSLRGGVAYVPRVRFRYTVDGAIYHSDRATLLDAASSRGWAEGIARRFRPGETVTARYDPSRPDQAYLIEDHGGLAYWLIGLGLLWEAGVVWMLIRWRRGPAAIASSAAAGRP